MNKQKYDRHQISKMKAANFQQTYEEKQTDSLYAI